MKTTYTKEQLIEAGHDEDSADRVIALCEFLDCEPSELSLERHDHYGLPVYSYSLGGREYAIGTDSEADDAALNNIKDSVWAFNASFILSQCDLPGELEDGIRAMQEKECEGANDALLALVEKCTTLKDFADAAVGADGRGHFLSSYDGEEIEAGEFYVYRIN